MSDEPCTSNAKLDNGFESIAPKTETLEAPESEEQLMLINNRLSGLEVAVERIEENMEEQNSTLEAICKHFNVSRPQRPKKIKSAPQMSVEDLRVRKASTSPPVQSGRVDKESREKLVKDLREKLERKRKENDDFELTLVDLRKKVAELRKAVSEHPNNPINKPKQTHGEEETKQNNTDTSK